MDNKFERVLGIGSPTIPYNEPPYLDENNAGGATLSDIIRTISCLKDRIDFLNEKVELYDTTFAAMFGKEEQRKEFIDFLKRYGSGDNFQIVKIMDAFNKLRSIERKEVETTNG